LQKNRVVKAAIISELIFDATPGYITFFFNWV